MFKKISVILSCAFFIIGSVFASDAKFKGDVATVDNGKWNGFIKLGFNTHSTEIKYVQEASTKGTAFALLRDDQYNAAELTDNYNVDRMSIIQSNSGEHKYDGGWKTLCKTGSVYKSNNLVVYDPHGDTCTSDSFSNWIFVVNKDKHKSYDLFTGGNANDCSGAQFHKVFNEKNQIHDVDDSSESTSRHRRVNGTIALPAATFDGQLLKACHENKLKAAVVVRAGHLYRLVSAG